MLFQVEAQACGTRVIGSNWAATPDLVSSDSWLTEGQLTWDAGQDAWWMTPNVSSLVNALEEAYKAERGPSQIAIDFASQFEFVLPPQNSLYGVTTSGTHTMIILQPSGDF